MKLRIMRTKFNPILKREPMVAIIKSREKIMNIKREGMENLKPSDFLKFNTTRRIKNIYCMPTKKVYPTKLKSQGS